MLSNSDEVKSRILECAARLFSDNGVCSTSLADISQAAQISKGTLYYYYATKEALVYDVCESHLNHMKGKICAWLESVQEHSKIEIVFGELIDLLTDDKYDVKLHVALCTEAVFEQGRLQIVIKEKYSEMGLLIDLASIRMNTSLNRIPNMKQMFFTALDGLMLHSLIGIESIDRRELLEKIFTK